MEPAGLEQLAASIRQSGLMQPVVVRRLPVGAAVGGARYELVAGERRWRAAAMAGLTAVPALIRDLSDEESAQLALVENLQREDLNPIDRAMAFRALCDRFGLSQAEVAQRVGLDRSSVTNLLRLIELPELIRAMIADGRLSAGHGKALLGVPGDEARLRLGERAAEEGWSVRRLEQAAQALAAEHVTTGDIVITGPGRPPNLVELERQLGEHLGTKVVVRSDRAGKRGRIAIEFYGIDHFDGLMSRMGFQMK
jgi:ParB family chromosome partitioning protein